MKHVSKGRVSAVREGGGGQVRLEVRHGRKGPTKEGGMGTSMGSIHHTDHMVPTEMAHHFPIGKRVTVTLAHDTSPAPVPPVIQAQGKAAVKAKVGQLAAVAGSPKAKARMAAAMGGGEART